MAAIHELLKQVQDPALRARLAEEFAHATQNKKFGLVFEEHLPECTPLYGIDIKRGSTVARKAAKISDTFTVIKLDDDIALCRNKSAGNMEEIKIDELVAVAEFGEPIFPYLEHIDSVENAPDSDLWHTLIEADNYHALQLLEYLYPQKVDCIYIDPPYNTGAKDWKYNNDYVDSTDAYRHSKWLSMMKKRLKLAKRLLNPEESVLIITIDEKEYLHLGCLLEEMFPDAKMQMISSAINSKGVARDEFFRVNEYLYILRFGNSLASSLTLSDEWRGNIKNTTIDKVRWGSLMRSGSGSLRTDSPGCFYPIYISKDKKHFCGAGNILSSDEKIEEVIVPEDVIALYPIHEDGVEGRWQYSRDKFLDIQKKGYVRISTQAKKEKEITLRYISEGWQKKVESGLVSVAGKATDGSLIFDDDTYNQEFLPSNQWWISSHNATEFGTKLLKEFVGNRNFPFPKSVYAVKDILRFFVIDKPKALIIDFFSGSGTTLHAVNLLNLEDDGKRRCILVTNNECSLEEEKILKDRGFKQGDEEWEKHGICKSITWPRTKCSILGQRDDGTKLDGEYFTNLTRDKEKSRNFLQIGFIKDAAAMKLKDKKQLLALFGKGVLPQNLVKADTKYIVSENEKHTISVLFDDSAVDEWIDSIDGMEHITDFYIVTEKKARFEEIKEKITEVLNPIVIEEQVKLPMKNGFAANCEYFKLGFLDKDMVSLGRQFYEILPLLWMKSGAKGKRPDYSGEIEPQMLVLPENHFAVLVDETCYSAFAREVRKYDDIETVYFITNSESAYHEMAQNLGIADSYQLYRNYLDNFVIGARRNRT